MNLHRHPQLIERLASAYALGTLRGGAKRRFEQLARQHPHIRAAALTWQARMGSLTELHPPQQPSPAVWIRIQNLLDADRQAHAMRHPATPAHHGRATTAPPASSASPAGASGWWGGLGRFGAGGPLVLWRAAAIVATATTVVAVGVALGLRHTGQRAVTELRAANAQLHTQLTQQQRIEYVAVLTDANGQRQGPEILVTFDANQQRLTLQRVGGYQTAADKSLQLWALPPGGDRPVSVGVLGPEALVHLPVPQGQLPPGAAMPTLAISLEPKGGVPGEGGPTGPVLFTGPVLPTPGT